jgi:hypothetical protein
MKELFLIFVVAFVLSWIPPLVSFLRSRRRFSGGRTVICPETHHAARIRLDAVHAAKTGLLGDPDLKVKCCDRWGGPVGHCHEGCVDENAPALQDRPSSAQA